jgi:hypothetical protein
MSINLTAGNGSSGVLMNNRAQRGPRPIPAKTTGSICGHDRHESWEGG